MATQKPAAPKTANKAIVTPSTSKAKPVKRKATIVVVTKGVTTKGATTKGKK